MEWPHGYAYYNYMVHSIEGLNSKIEQLRSWSRSNLLKTMDEMENEVGMKKENDWKRFVELLEKLDLEIWMEENG